MAKVNAKEIKYGAAICPSRYLYIIHLSKNPSICLSDLVRLSLIDNNGMTNCTVPQNTQNVRISYAYPTWCGTLRTCTINKVPTYLPIQLLRISQSSTVRRSISSK